MQGRERIGAYEILGRIGTGGGADLLLAVRDGRRVVIKRMHAHLAEEADYVRMFIAEAKVMALLHDDNVVHAVDVDEDEHPTWFAMDLVDGPSFAAALRLLQKKSEPCPAAVVIAVGARVAAGLHAVHTARDPATGEPLHLVHRDVAAPNILLSRDGDVKLTDFGVVKVPKRDGGGSGFVTTKSTSGGVLKGHLGTMAPEQIRGGVVDGRADLYSLGVVLWEALAGRKMWEGAPLELVDKITNEPAPDLRDALRGPFAAALATEEDAVADLLARMLAKDPGARPASALAVRDSLFARGPATASEVADVVRGLGLPSLAM